MSAATATLATPASLVHEAHAALHLAANFPAKAGLGREIITLVLALRTCEEIDPEAMGWGWTWPRLSDGDDRKLLAAAERAETAAGALIAAMAERQDMKTDKTSKTETAGVAS